MMVTILPSQNLDFNEQITNVSIWRSQILKNALENDVEYE